MAEKKSTGFGYDYMILIPVILLAGLGLVLVYSASSHLAAHRLGDSYFYLRRQALFCMLGVALMIMAKNIPCTVYSKMAYPLLFASFGLLVFLVIPGFGYKVGGATRWLRIAGYTFQPSELAKFSLTVYVAYSMAKKRTEMARFSRGLLPHLILVGAFMTLILLQPDLGTAVVIGGWFLIVLFVGGAGILQLLSLLALSVPVGAWLIWQESYRINRWWAFINPW